MMNNQNSELDQKPSAGRAPQGPARGAPASGKVRADEMPLQKRPVPKLFSLFGKSTEKKKMASSFQSLGRSDSATSAAFANRIDIAAAAVGQQQQQQQQPPLPPPPRGIPTQQTASSSRSLARPAMSPPATGVPQRKDTAGGRLSEKKHSSRSLTRLESSKSAGVASQRNLMNNPTEAGNKPEVAAGSRRVYQRRAAQERLQARQQRAEGGSVARLRAPKGLDTSLHRSRTTSEPLTLAVPRMQERRSCANDETMKTQVDESLRTSITENIRRASSGTPSVDLSRRHRRASGLSSVRVGAQSRFDRPISPTDDEVTLESLSAGGTNQASSSPFNESFLTEEWTPHHARESETQPPNQSQPMEMLPPSTQDTGPTTTNITNDAMISDAAYMAHSTPDIADHLSLGTTSSSINAGMISEREVDDELQRQYVIWGHYERKKERDELRRQNRELLALLRAKEQEDQQRTTTAQPEVQDTDQAVALALEMSLQDTEHKNDEDEGLSLAMEISRQESEMRGNAENALDLVMELSRQETLGREQESETLGEEDNTLNLVMELSRQESQARERDPEVEEDENALKQVMELSRQETLEREQDSKTQEEDNALNLVMQLSRQESQARAQEPEMGEEDNTLNLIMELTRQETQAMEQEPEVEEEDNDLTLVVKLSKREAQGGDDNADMDLMRAMELSRQGVARSNVAQSNDIDESLEMALRASLEDSRPPLTDEGEDAEWLRVLGLSRYGQNVG